jgi:hypothetical protein
MGGRVPFEVTRLLGMMLAPSPHDHGPRLEVKLPKRWTEQKTVDKYQQARLARDEIRAAYNSNGKRLKAALIDVGKARAARGVPSSRAYLMKCWKKSKPYPPPPDHFAVVQRRFLELGTSPGAQEMNWYMNYERLRQQLLELLDQRPKPSTKSRRVAPSAV